MSSCSCMLVRDDRRAYLEAQAGALWVLDAIKMLNHSGCNLRA